MDSMAGVRQPSGPAFASDVSPSDSSATVRAALDRIEHATRLLCGDVRPSLDDLLIGSTGTDAASMHAATAAAVAAAIAPVGASSFDGALLHALPSLLAPLLSAPSSSATASSSAAADALYMIRQAAFQPRQCLARAQELRALLSGEDGGDAGALLGIKTANRVLKERQDSASGASGSVEGASSSSSRAPSYDVAHLLEQRRNARQRSDQADMDVASEVLRLPLAGFDGHDGASNTQRERGRDHAQSGASPDHDNALALAHRFAQRLRQATPLTTRGPAIDAQQHAFTTLLNEWQQMLSSVDAEAAASLSVSLRWLSPHAVRLRLDIDQVGAVVLWLHWMACAPTSATEPATALSEEQPMRSDAGGDVDKDGDTRAEPYSVRIERLNVLADADANLHSDARVNGSVNGEGRAEPSDDEATRLSEPSAFPLYRQISSQLLAGILRSNVPLRTSATSAAAEQPEKSTHDASRPGEQHSLVVLLGCLFACARLCRLHDPLHPFVPHPEQPPPRVLESAMNGHA